MSQQEFQDYGLSDVIVTALKKLGYDTPTKVQKEVIPLVKKGVDLLVKSQTGSGKTAAYGIPICDSIDWLENKPQALILVPTRELAVQVKDDFINIGRLKRIKATAIYGRESFDKQKIELKQKNHVVVATPGRVLDHLERGTINLAKIKYLVIDEADEMLAMGFLDQVKAILQNLPTERVTMLFSATLPDRIQNMGKEYMKDPDIIEIEPEQLMVNQVSHVVYRVIKEDKIQLLTDVAVMESPDSCILFCNTKDTVEEIYHYLKTKKYPCERIHGDMEQKDRLKVMEAFRRGEFRYLVATDVAARGIDIENVPLVLQFDVPYKVENYVHRSGRTGRAGLNGKNIMFVTESEKRYLKAIEEYVGFKIDEQDKPSKEMVEEKLSLFYDKLKHKPQIKKAKNEQLNQGIMTLCFHGGKKKKLRATNFVGVISNIAGVTAEDIGIITINETNSYIDILNHKGPLVLDAMKNITICGKKIKVTVRNRR